MAKDSQPDPISIKSNKNKQQIILIIHYYFQIMQIPNDDYTIHNQPPFPLNQGQELLIQYSFKINYMMQNRQILWIDEIWITNYRVVLLGSQHWHYGKYQGRKVSIPYGYIQEIKCEKRDIMLLTKSGPTVTIHSLHDHKALFQELLSATIYIPFCNRYLHDHETCLKYDYSAELQRMRINWQLYGIVENKKGKICQAYPKYFVIPKGLNGHLVEEVRKCRHGDMIPALAYYYEQGKSSLWRSSKLKSGFQSNKYNQAYLQQISRNIQQFTLTTEGQANKQENLPEIILEPLQTLHSLFKKMVISYTRNDVNLMKYAGRWLEDCMKLVQQALKIAKLMKQGRSVIVQGGSGYDRVPQLTALVQLIIDPFYRTFKGFGLLVEKQFAWFGHPFDLRLGVFHTKQQQMSPILQQFLECSYHLLCHYPGSFEFSSHYLSRINYQLYTTRYNNFIFNSYQDRQQSKYFKLTVSVWSDKVANSKKSYYNYQFNHDLLLKFLPDITKKSPTIKTVTIWKEFYDVLVEMEGEVQEGDTDGIREERKQLQNFLGGEQDWDDV